MARRLSTTTRDLRAASLCVLVCAGAACGRWGETGRADATGARPEAREAVGVREVRNLPPADPIPATMPAFEAERDRQAAHVAAALSSTDTAPVEASHRGR